jgi:putative transposase
LIYFVLSFVNATAALGCQGRRGVCTTQRAPRAQPAPDRLGRCFVAEAPNRVWTADVAYVPIWTGFRYLAVVLDAYSRCIVGRAKAAHLQAELLLGALDIALCIRRPARAWRAQTTAHGGTSPLAGV